MYPVACSQAVVSHQALVSHCAAAAAQRCHIHPPLSSGGYNNKIFHTHRQMKISYTQSQMKIHVSHIQ
jgi:hypothetical protein